LLKGFENTFLLVQLDVPKCSGYIKEWAENNRDVLSWKNFQVVGNVRNQVPTASYYPLVNKGVNRL